MQRGQVSSVCLAAESPAMLCTPEMHISGSSSSPLAVRSPAVPCHYKSCILRAPSRLQAPRPLLPCQSSSAACPHDRKFNRMVGVLFIGRVIANPGPAIRTDPARKDPASTIRTTPHSVFSSPVHSRRFCFFQSTAIRPDSLSPTDCRMFFSILPRAACGQSFLR